MPPRSAPTQCTSPRATGSRHMAISAAEGKNLQAILVGSRVEQVALLPGFQGKPKIVWVFGHRRFLIWTVEHLEMMTPVLSCASFRVRPALRPARVTRGVARNFQRPRLRAESSFASPRRSTQGSRIVASAMASTLARLSKYAKGENTTSVLSHAKVRRALSLTLHADSRRAR